PAQVIRSVAEMDGPCYVRLSRPATPLVCPEGYRFQPGKASVFRPGDDVSILATGIMVAKALEAADNLAEEGIDARVVNVSTLKPIDQECIIRCAHETGAVVTAEEHLKHGGLGSIVSQVLVENCPVPVSTVAIEDVYSHSGEADELLELRGLTHEKIEVAVREVVARKG
ncbi:MAG: transketolase family protein, partial [Chloroflexi bacterium]|nr:transketolase family protein [Chloroflexota bacterium]